MIVHAEKALACGLVQSECTLCVFKYQFVCMCVSEQSVCESV